MQAQPTMIDPYLQGELKPGEQLLWWGRPDPTRRSKNRAVTATYITYGVTSCVWVLLIFFSLSIYASFGVDLFTTFLLLVAILLLCLNLYRAYLLYRQTRKATRDLSNTIYGLTNQRIIVMTNNGHGFSVKSHSRDDIGQILRVETGDGWGEVSYGKPRTIQTGRRTTTIVDKLTGIPNARLVEDILFRTFKSAPSERPQAFYQQPAYDYPSGPEQYLPQALDYPPAPEQYLSPQVQPGQQAFPQE